MRDRHMSHIATLGVSQIANAIGLSVRQLQRLAKRGDLPGVQLKTDTYHHTYTDCPALREFIAKKKQFRKGRLPSKRRKKSTTKLSTFARLKKAAAQVSYWCNRNRTVLRQLNSGDLRRINNELLVCWTVHQYINGILEMREARTTNEVPPVNGPMARLAGRSPRDVAADRSDADPGH
jgi:hypothetical protein